MGGLNLRPVCLYTCAQFLLRQSILAKLAYTYLCLDDPVSALTCALQLKNLPCLQEPWRYTLATITAIVCGGVRESLCGIGATGLKWYLQVGTFARER